RPASVETTALGAAWLAGMRAGIYPDIQGFAGTWARDKRFQTAMPSDEASTKYARWKRAVQATQSV
ncbi:MAG: glycerol kinase, partial [Paracoccaceae bacterium]